MSWKNTFWVTRWKVTYLEARHCTENICHMGKNRPYVCSTNDAIYFEKNYIDYYILCLQILLLIKIEQSLESAFCGQIWCPIWAEVHGSSLRRVNDVPGAFTMQLINCYLYMSFIKFLKTTLSLNVLWVKPMPQIQNTITFIKTRIKRCLSQQ